MSPAGADARVVLRYDSDCRFCSASARYLEARSGGRVRLQAAPGIAAAEFEDAHGTRRGGAAVTSALARSESYLLRVAARILDLPGVHLARDAGYAVAARSRWLLSKVAAT